MGPGEDIRDGGGQKGKEEEVDKWDEGEINGMGGITW